MAQGNPHFHRLNTPYIFPIIEEKLEKLKSSPLENPLINMGIGDTSLPLAPAISQALKSAIDEMSVTSYGYGPSAGYSFLREAVTSHEYAKFGLTAEEIFISDGINSDITGILDLFSSSSVVALPTPSYPAYYSASTLAGKKIVFMPCDESSRFVPKPPASPPDVIYLCSPHNPTGVAMNREELTNMVSYAKKHKAIILFDAAYAAFIRSSDVPKSIYEIPGADEVALEFRSFSKSAGFTGLRCAYLALPKKVQIQIGEKEHSLHSLWNKRQSIRFNGVAYPIQKGALATFSSEGKAETEKQVSLYVELAKELKEGLISLGQTCVGGSDSPYIWWKTPGTLSSWDFFDRLLNECQILAVPGPGFGEGGEGYIRLSAFSSKENVANALTRIQKVVSV